MMTAEEKASWLNQRCGKLTASRMADAMSFLKNGSSSRDRTKLMYELLAERLTGDSISHNVTEAMLFGAEHEDEAADFFVEMTGRTLKRSRFYEHPTIENFGATPDRELDDGLVEIKVPTSQTFVEHALNPEVPEQYRPQMCAQLLCTNKTWCGLIVYDPRIREEKRRLIMRKYEPTAEELQKVQDAAIVFLADLDQMFDQFVRTA